MYNYKSLKGDPLQIIRVNVRVQYNDTSKLTVKNASIESS